MNKKKILGMLFFILIFSTVFVNSTYAESTSSYISGGWGTTFYITQDGNLWGFGKNAEKLLLSSESYVSEPKVIMGQVKSVSVNRYSVLVVKKDNTLWYWGNIGSEKSIEPKKLMDDVMMVSSDDYYSTPILVLKGDGTLLYGNSKEFIPISHGEKIKFVSTSGNVNFFINDKNEAFGWSTDKNGSVALGLGEVRESLTPEKILDDVVYIAGDNSNTMFIKADASLWMCGGGFQGYFYDGQKSEKATLLSPVKIMDNVIQVAARDGEFFAVKKDNTLWAWGENRNKAIGDVHLKVPTKYADGVESIWVATGHILVAKTDHTLWTAGSKDGVYQSKSGFNPLRLSAKNLVDSPAPWALAEVREAEYRKLIPPQLQSDYTKIVTRSEFCTLAITCLEQLNQKNIDQILNEKGLTLPSVSPFEDLNGLSAQAKKDILAAYVLGVVEGTSPTTFTPMYQITREQAAKMLSATAKAMDRNIEANTPNFSDEAKIASWAKPFIGYVFNADIMSGIGNQNFGPKGGYQRQQAYMTMLRLYKYLIQ